MRRRALARRLVALVLSWVVPATSAWAVAPPVVAAGAPPLSGLSVVPGLSAALGRAALEAHDGSRDDDRRDRDDRDRKGDRGRPILLRCECVEDEGDGTYTAHFGYESRNEGAVTVKAGLDNQLVPLPGRRDQPTRFLPGRSRGWPESAFRLRFDGKPVTWMLKGPDGVTQRATASRHSPRCGGLPPCVSPFWGPKKYEVKARSPRGHDDRDGKDRDESDRDKGKGDRDRDRDDRDQDDRDEDDRDHEGHGHKRGEKCERDDHNWPTEYEETITLPPGVAPPYRLTLVNGGPALRDRVLLGSVFLDGRHVIGPFHANPLVRQVTVEVVLKAQSRLKVRLVGLPGSFVTLSICGSSAADTTPPTIQVADPAAGALLADTTPSLRVVYADPPGAGAASGLDLATLAVTLDGQDRTAWFTKGPAEATAEVPADAALAEGSHRLEARIRDVAGNEGTATPVEFRVDSLPPQVAITQPQDGTFTSATAVDVSGTVADASPITRLRVNGEDATLNGASFTAPAVPIGDGPEVTIEVEAEDAAGNLGRASVRLRVDRRSPTVTITRPAEGDTVQGPVLEVEGTVDDDGDVRVEVNGTPEDPPPSLRAPRSFVAHVPITDGTTRLTATARDAAGNAGATFVTVHTDTVAPTVVIGEPGPGLVTKETSVHVTGTATDASGVASVTVDGVPAAVAADGSFEADVPLGGEGTQTITVVATDNAGNAAAPATVDVTIDRTTPAFTIASPDADALLGTLPVVVQGTVQDPHLDTVTVDGVTAVVTGLAWQASLAGLGDGPHTLTAVARDKAGNERTLTRDVRIDTGFPVVTITAPAHQALLRDGSVAVTGTVRDASLQSLRVNGQPVVWTGDPSAPEGATFTLAALALAEGANGIEALAEDGLARQGSASVTVVRDSLPPSVELSATSLLVRGRSEKAIASASDGTGSGVASVEFLVDGQPAATLGQPPFELPLEPPTGLASGQSFTVAARATDVAGNVSALVSRVVTVVSEGVVVGQVLADETSLPLADATVRLVDAAAPPALTDARGRYTLPAQSASALVVAEAANRTAVERELPVAVGTGAVPVDARLTRLAAPVTIGPDGGEAAVVMRLARDAAGSTATAGAGGSARLAVAIPTNALAADTPVHLTALSPQGLPGLLPLGWSPLAAFDLRTEGAAALAGPLAATLAARDAKGEAAAAFAGWPAAPVALVEYRPALHAWVLVEAGLAPTAGELAFALPGAGSFALVVADAGDPAPVVPAPGEALAGVPLASLPATAASRALVEPAVLPPSGGTAHGTLVVDSPIALPSGTVVQARVSETFSLASGATASSEERPMDIVLFRAPCTGLVEAGGVASACPDAGVAAIAARVPLTPSRSFGTTELLEGKVHLDILAGRESARGTTGGKAPVVVESGTARLAVPGLALGSDTAIALRTPDAPSSLLPETPGLEAVAEVDVDLSGASLQLAAELSVAAAVADGTFVVARVERVDGIPRLAVVAMAALLGDRLVTQPSSILPGVTREGRHVFYRLSGPVGFVSGTTTMAGAGGAKALVTAEGLPFIAASEPTGAYVLTTLPAAAVTVRARISGTPFQAEGGPVEVRAGEATGLDLLLSGAATTARVTPPNGSAGIAVNARIEITPTVPFDLASVAAAQLSLTRASDAQAVPLRRVAGVGGRSLSVIPERKIGDEFVPLEFATAYTLTVTGLRDAYGNDVAVPPTTFTTQVFTPPVLDVTRLVFDVPDDNGIVKVHAPGGSFVPGTTVLIVNSGNGVVLSLVADNDGAVDGELPGSADDRLLVTLTDPQGNAQSFERSQYLIDPLTGETAVGAGGGVVTSPDAPGYELRVPKDATGQAVHLKIRALSLADFPELPALPEAEFGAALEVTSPQRPTFKKEVDLAFPLSLLPPLPPDAKPEEAFYSVVRELKGPAGETYFQTIDEAKVECPDGQTECDAAEKKVVTASFPFPGMMTTFGGLTGAFALLALETTRYLLMRTFTAAAPGRSQWGVITGRVLRPVATGTPGQYRYDGVPGCAVRRVGIGTGEVLAETQPGGENREIGRLTFHAPWFTGGSVELKATCEGRDYTGTAYVVSGGSVEAVQDDGVKRLIGTGHYQTIGYVNITLPVAQQPAAAPRVEIRIFKEEADGRRTDLRGSSIAGTPFQVGVRAPGYVVRDVKLRGESQTILVPDPLKNTKPKDTLAFDAILQDAYLPSAAGSYVIEATAMDPAALTTVTGETVMQVLREAGGSPVSVPGRPGVITARTVPRNDARGVSVSVFPQLDFTEPVKGVGPSNVQLVPVGCAPPPEGSTSTEPTCTDSANSEADPGDPVPLRILATTAGSPPESIEITGTESPAPSVVSLLLQPLVSLSFGTKYRLEVGVPPTSGTATPIVDEDGETLLPYTSRFSTFLPEDVGQSNEADKPTVTGLVVLGERGYVLETLHGGGVAGPQQASTLRVYDVSDPVEPKDLTEQANGGMERTVISFPPRDIAGEEVKAEGGTPTGQKLIAIATAPRTFYQVQGTDPYWTELKSTPANLFLYDVSDPEQKPRWIGAANITNNVVDGIPNRLFLQQDRIYAATYPKGIQVISIPNLRNGFPPPAEEREPNGLELTEIHRQLFAGGLNPGAIVLTIPVKDPTNGLNMPLNDLEVMDLSVWGVPRKVVAATGSRPQAGLVLADAVSPYFDTVCDPGATLPKPLWLGPLTKDGSSLDWGGAIALTKINDKPHALVGGTGIVSGAGSQTLLAIVDLTPVAPAVTGCGARPSPSVVAIVPLPKLTGVGDILLIGNTAVVSGAQGTRIDGQPGGAALVDFTAPAAPEVVGYVKGIASRMAVDANNILFSGHKSFVKGTDPALGGVKTAALEQVTFFISMTGPFQVEDGKSRVPVDMRIGVVPSDFEVKTAEVDILKEGAVLATVPVALGPPRRAELAKGFPFDVNARYEAEIVINRGIASQELRRRRAIQAVELALLETQRVDVAQSGETKKLDVVKLHNARPRVDFRAQEPGSPGLPTEGVVDGRVNDDLAPIDTVWVNGVKVAARPLDVLLSTDRPTDPIEPFHSDFSTNIYRVQPELEAASMDSFPLPSVVTYGAEGMLLAASAVNALGNAGWMSAQYTPNIDPDGSIREVEKKLGKRLPPGESAINYYYPVEDGVPEREQRRFRIQVTDVSRGAMRSVHVELYTGIEDPHVVTLYRVGNLFKSPPLFLVPEEFKLPDGLKPALRDRLKATRIKAKLGTKMRVSYIRPEVDKEAVVSGAALVDDSDRALRFVPGQTLAPQVLITDVSPQGISGASGNAQVRVSARIVDPIAAALSLSSGSPLLKVTVNGTPVIPLRVGDGSYAFDATFSIPPLPQTHLQVRAESTVSGGWGVDDRFLLFEDEDGNTLDPPSVEEGFGPRGFTNQARPFRVKIYAPPTDPAAITGTLQGLYSKELTPSADLPSPTPPVVRLAFDAPSCSNDVCTYTSKDKFLASKVPGHALREPFGAPQSGAALVVPVEVGGLVEGRVDLGPAGILGALTDVSGAEIVTPREGSILNLTKQNVPSLFSGVQGVSVKWRGITALHVYLQSSGTTTEAGTPKLPVGSLNGFAAWPKESTVIKFSAWAQGPEHLFSLERAQDQAGNSFSDEAMTFVYSQDLVANPSPLTPMHPSLNPSDTQVAAGRFLAPTVLQGFDLFYRGGLSDVIISEHLRMNGLRPVAIKRNQGTLVTAVRVDGKDSMFEPMVREVPDGIPRSGSRPDPLGDVAIDGDDLRWREIEAIGLDAEYLSTYETWDDHGRPIDGARERSRIIEKARVRLGLAPLEGGKTVEYQTLQNAADWRLLKQTLEILLVLEAPIRALFRGFSFVTIGTTAEGALVPAVVEPPLIEGAAGIDESLMEYMYLINRPKLTRIADQPLVASGSEIRSLAYEYRQAQREIRLYKTFGLKNQVKAAHKRMVEISNRLGSAAVREVAAAHPELNIPAGTAPICCTQFAQLGGGATGQFDFVYEAANGRYVLIEAKGGVSYLNPRAWRNAGRRIVDAVTGARTFEIQGTRAYVDKTIELMQLNPETTDIALKLRNAFRDNQLEYYVVSAKWSTRAPAGKALEFGGKGLAWGAQKAARVFKADLSQSAP